VKVTAAPVSTVVGFALGVPTTGSESTVNSSVPLILDCESESVTVTETAYVPGAVGRQEIESVVEGEQLSPAAKEPQL